MLESYRSFSFNSLLFSCFFIFVSFSFIWFHFVPFHSHSFSSFIFGWFILLLFSFLLSFSFCFARLLSVCPFLFSFVHLCSILSASLPSILPPADCWRMQTFVQLELLDSCPIHEILRNGLELLCDFTWVKWTSWKWNWKQKMWNYNSLPKPRWSSE
jgi:hypothetical protein